jgi:hypothetical protein
MIRMFMSSRYVGLLGPMLPPRIKFRVAFALRYSDAVEDVRWHRSGWAHSCICGSSQSLLHIFIGEWVRPSFVLALWARMCASGTHLVALPLLFLPQDCPYCGSVSSNVMSHMSVYMKMIRVMNTRVFLHYAAALHFTVSTLPKHQDINVAHSIFVPISDKTRTVLCALKFQTS